MRYAPPGLCVNDFALLRDDDGGYAVLHLQGPWTAEFDHLRMETSYGRATSTDLVRWKPEGTAFGNGLPGRFDQQAVWTMHPFRHGTGMAMFYTGVAGLTPDGWPLQSVGLAYSDRTDGTGWRRHGTGPSSRRTSVGTAPANAWAGATRSSYATTRRTVGSWSSAPPTRRCRRGRRLRRLGHLRRPGALDGPPAAHLTGRRGRVGVPGPRTPRRRQLVADRFDRRDARLRGMDRAASEGAVDPPRSAGPDRLVRPPRHRGA